MDKVRFACPRCQTIMQTAAEKIGYDVACPHCAHRFRLIESPEQSTKRLENSVGVDDPTIAPRNSPLGNSLQGNSPAGRDLPTTGRTNPSELTRSPSPTTTAADRFAGGTATVLGPVETAAQQRFSCQYCQTNRPPTWKSEVSQVGWIVFAILLVSCVTAPLCFVGLFIRDKYQVCSQCKIRLG